MGENEKFIILMSVVLLAIIIDIRLGLVLSCVIFGIFLIFFINKKMHKTEIRENYEVTYLGQPKKNDDVHYNKIQKPCFKSLDCYKLYTDPNRVQPRVVERDMLSKNNRLQGGQNPKTLIPPMVTRPAYDIEWKKNTMIVPNMINGQTNEAIAKSGYMPAPGGDVTFSMIEPRRSHHPIAEKNVENGEVIENFDMNYSTATWDDRVLDTNGYDAEQFKMNKYPANLPRGNCGRDPVLEAHNESLFTTSIQPGVYYTNQVAEPINSNIGISFQQQFLPRTYKKDDGNLSIVDHDPHFAPPRDDIIEYPEEPKADNVFDPRFNGYGTSYRNYIDPMTGQPRFPYDDINAIRMPNYVVRSKIDTHNFSDSYGPIQNSGLNLNDIRQKAQDAYLEDTTNFRDEMMTRLMRKRNSELWQTKQFPRTGAGRMLSGGAPMGKRS
uniref:Uncharacterized protein n=1 Tax=viral metagenome TaxID=1070528 RepID=A0A6C0KQU7_9ZZZZ